MACACAASISAALADPGDWLLSGRAGRAEIGLLACSDGRRLADSVLPEPAVAAPTFALGGTIAIVPTEASRLLAYALPSFRETGRRSLSMQPTQLASSEPEGTLLAVGGSGPEPLVLLDAASLAELHAYRPDRASTVSSIRHAGPRSSFVVGFEEPVREAEVWELAWRADAPPVYKGLVHDYRMGEAIALPGQFTPRVAPVSTPTLALSAGVRADEWLRLGADGVPGVLHLEVRREIVRIPEIRDALASWQAAAWQAGETRGWYIGSLGDRLLHLLQAGNDWRLSSRIELPGGLLAMAGFDDGASIVLAVGEDAELARSGSIRLWRLDAATATLQPAADRVGAVAATDGPVRLQRSRDGRCIALLDATGRWLSAVRD
ncbi:MAG: hypothetical protein GX644_07790 [Limnobacter sp.]|nr:hypothetical protein [Limnobacter sp.]